MAKTKANPLAAAFDAGEAQKPQAIEQPKAVAEKAPRVAKKAAKGGRQGKQLIGGHFPPSVAKQLGMIAVEEGTTRQALLEEALNLLFAAKGKKLIGL